MPAMPRAGFALLIGLSVVGAVSAQEEPPLVTDRPDQTESAQVVPVGSFQLEVGAGYVQDGSGALRLRALGGPTTLLRIGVLPVLEGRVGFAGWMRRSSSGAAVVSGVGDLDVGGKLRVLAGRGSLPMVAVLATVVLPTGQAGFGAVRADPVIRVAVSHDLSERVSLGYNVGAVWGSADDGAGGSTTDTDLLYTLVLGSSLTPALSGFIEGFGTVVTASRRASAHALDAGITLLLSDTVQFDASGGVGLSASADDWFGGVGLSVRVPR